MNTLLIINWIATAAVVAYALGLFTYLLKTRYNYVQLGRKEEFNIKMSDRINDIVEKVFGQSKLLKDKKMGLIHVLFFYGFLMVQLGAIDLIWKGIAPGSVLTTYCSKGVVKQRLRESGFHLERLTGPPGKRHILRACKL